MAAIHGFEDVDEDFLVFQQRDRTTAQCGIYR
jgi:hypothetical protein